MMINRTYEQQKSSFAVACFFPGRTKDLSAPLHLPNAENRHTRPAKHAAETYKKYPYR